MFWGFKRKQKPPVSHVGKLFIMVQAGVAAGPLGTDFEHVAVVVVTVAGVCLQPQVLFNNVFDTGEPGPDIVCGAPRCGNVLCPGAGIAPAADIEDYTLLVTAADCLANLGILLFLI